MWVECRVLQTCMHFNEVFVTALCTCIGRVSFFFFFQYEVCVRESLCLQMGLGRQQLEHKADLLLRVFTLWLPEKVEVIVCLCRAFPRFRYEDNKMCHF